MKESVNSKTAEVFLTLYAEIQVPENETDYEKYFEQHYFNPANSTEILNRFGINVGTKLADWKIDELFVCDTELQ